MKRIASFLLAAVLLAGVMFAGLMPAYAEETEAQTEEQGMVASDECIATIKAWEGFSKYPYWDYAQYTVGYGTRCPDDMREEYTKNGITEEEAEKLLRNHLGNVYAEIHRFEEKNSLSFTQNQFDALVSFSYNCGTAWMLDKNGALPKAIFAGATGSAMVRAFAVWCNAGGDILEGLLKRRLCEANMYLNNQYSATPPSHYGYVLYDANGGVSKPKSQGYDANLTAVPFPVPTYDGYTFDGWYTAKNGGTKVTVLDNSTKGKTFYAHWKDASGNEVVEEQKYVKVKVTSNFVNVRQGPGTNYAKLGEKHKGDEMVITETGTGSNLRWGKFDGGWVALMYTNYDTAVKDPNCIVKPGEEVKPSEPSKPETTEPDTKPDTDTTEQTKVMGTVKVNGELNIRSGPSTGHSVAGSLKNGARVQILAQKTVGSMVWGQIDKGWISMQYVKLDSATSGGSDSGSSGGSTPAQTWTGTVTSNDILNIRSGAGTNYPVAGFLNPGDKVTITEKKTVGTVTWGKIVKGWISLSYVKLDGSGSTGSSGSSGGSSSTTATTITGTITASELRIRSAAGTANTIVGYLKAGDKVEITQTTKVGNTTWGKIAKGWISMDYVKTSGSTGSSGDSSSSGGSSSGSGQTGTVVNCNHYLNIRSNAGTNNPLVGQYYPGDKVTITEQKQVGDTMWGKTDRGWVSMYYIKLGDSGAATQTSSKTVTASCLCVRKTPGTTATIVGYLYYGAKVTILETKDVAGMTWGRTSGGWVSMQYVK